MTLTFSALLGRLAIVSRGPRETIPPWAGLADPAAPFVSITRTADELSIVCPEGLVPPGVRCGRGFRALKLLGPFALDQAGILASVVGPLADAGVAAFVVATFETDYVLVAEEQLDRAIEALEVAGHGFAGSPGDAP